ncbi:hypothetical protein [Methylogaea oryzae]|uniref:Uncharacterized protein n=1 Tax=Methylogaea oryzae TaxID=1295382 RepID=A0A8D4VQN3_9GAMM|nr:hypothetical protein [Methylogaea oryzae]BBL71559.1 hypothetical protein MoryE10_21650 [Methylogaea oryzae]
MEIQDFGEHHMASSHIRVRLEQPFSGVCDFHSTNGYGLFFGNGELLLVGDACMFVILDFSNGNAKHCYPPKGWYFKRPELSGGEVSAGLYNANGDSASFGPVSIEDPRWEAGLGRARNGLLPSVYLPYYKATFK